MSKADFFEQITKGRVDHDELPGLGKVEIRELNAPDWLSHVRFANELNKSGVEGTETIERAHLVYMSVYQKGKRVFTEKEIDKLAKSKGGTLHRLYFKSLTLNDMLDDPAKNS